MFDDVGRIIEVEDREYVLVSRINEGGDTFVYLMSVTSPLDVLIAKEKEVTSSITELVFIKEEDEKRRIYDLFLKVANLGLL